ncbi:MAG: hypothetical protein ABI903_08540 [Actinomycetota bacterium]
MSGTALPEQQHALLAMRADSYSATTASLYAAVKTPDGPGRWIRKYRLGDSLTGLLCG